MSGETSGAASGSARVGGQGSTGGRRRAFTVQVRRTAGESRGAP